MNPTNNPTKSGGGQLIFCNGCPKSGRKCDFLFREAQQITSRVPSNVCRKCEEYSSQLKVLDGESSSSLIWFIIDVMLQVYKFNLPNLLYGEARGSGGGEREKVGYANSFLRSKAPGPLSPY